MAKQNETKLMQVVIFVEGDTDVFEVRNPLIVNWDALRKTVKRMGIQEFLQLGIRSSIEDWLLCDMEGICRYLGLSYIPKSLKGSVFHINALVVARHA